MCGRVLGYQQNAPDAFRLFIENNASISQVYFDGLAILCVVIFEVIYGHILLGIMTIKVDRTVVHVTLVVHNQFLL